jgi:hypothetical protein
MKAQNGGMLGVDRGAKRRSYAILTRNFPRKRRLKDKNGRNRGFGVFSGAIAGAVPEELIPSWRKGVQSGPEQSRARSGASEAVLDGEDRSAKVSAGRNGPSTRHK